MYVILEKLVLSTHRQNLPVFIFKMLKKETMFGNHWVQGSQGNVERFLFTRRKSTRFGVPETALFQSPPKSVILREKPAIL